jgi:hypothetical protein
MAGAASAGPPEQLRSAARQNSPAGRAGLLRRTAPQPTLPDDADTADWDMPATGRHAAVNANGYHAADDAYDEPAAARRGRAPGRPHSDDGYAARTRRRGRRRFPIVTTILVVFVILVVGTLYGTWRYTQTQYYLGIDNGYMAIFRGVNTSAAGMSLHSPYQRSSVPVSQLSADWQHALSQTISTKGLSDARSTLQSVETGVGQCRTQWHLLASWKIANDEYQVKLADYNTRLSQYNQEKAHLKPGQKLGPPPTAPTSPGLQPQVPPAASCGSASSFGIKSGTLPPGTPNLGTVTPSASSSPTPTPSIPTATATVPTTPAGGSTTPPNSKSTPPASSPTPVPSSA